MKKAKVLTAVLAAAVLSVQALSIVPGSISAAEKGQLTACAYTENKDGTWVKVGVRWRYRHTDGTYTRSDWEKINNKWYYFDKYGLMQTGWMTLDGKTYYLHEGGSMHTGWIKLDHKYYYFSGSGAMRTGWLKYKNEWYLLRDNGVMARGWGQSPTDGLYYWFDPVSGEWDGKPGVRTIPIVL